MKALASMPDNMKAISMFIADFDRTITDRDLKIDERCISMIAELRGRGIHTSLVTGRKQTFMEIFLERYQGVFESIICENGCRAYLNNDWHALAESDCHTLVIEKFSEAEIEFDYGECIVSTEALSESEVASLLSDISGWRSIVNVDSIMILPPGIDKGTGIRWLQSMGGFSKEKTAGIGDGENDMVMRELCGVFGTPASAVSSLKDVADFVSSEEYSQGTRDFLGFLITNYSPPMKGSHKK